MLTIPFEISLFAWRRGLSFLYSFYWRFTTLALDVHIGYTMLTG